MGIHHMDIMGDWSNKKLDIKPYGIAIHTYIYICIIYIYIYIYTQHMYIYIYRAEAGGSPEGN